MHPSIRRDRRQHEVPDEQGERGSVLWLHVCRKGRGDKPFRWLRSGHEPGQNEHTHHEHNGPGVVC
jgi:hypothetical protein